MIRNKKGVSPVIAVVLLVSITVVLAATAYILVSNMTDVLSEKPPYMGFSNRGITSGYRKIEFASVEYEYSLEKYSFLLLINGTSDEYSRMDPLFNGTIGNVTFGDYEGKLGAGDFFLIKIVPETRYTVKIFWRPSGDQAGTISWMEA